MRRDYPQSDEPQDIRYKMTSTVWGYATGMLGISIPLAAITESGLIPFAVVAGTAVATVAIWGGFGNKTLGELPSDQIRQLEERLANLETIVSYEEDNNLKLKIQQLKSQIE